MRNSLQISDSKPIVIAGQFAEFDQLTEVTAAWDIDFRQVGKGKLNATLSQATGESWSLAMARFDRPAFQQGTTVAGMRTFAILDSNASEQEWCGRRFSPDTIAVFAGDGAFQGISQPGFDVHTLSFSDEKLASACERLGVPDVTEKLLSRAAVLQIDRRQTRELRYLVKSALQALCKKGLEGSGWDDGDHISDKISEHLVLLFTDNSYLSYTPSQRLRSRAIRSALSIRKEWPRSGGPYFQSRALSPRLPVIGATGTWGNLPATTNVNLASYHHKLAKKCCAKVYRSRIQNQSCI